MPEFRSSTLRRALLIAALAAPGPALAQASNGQPDCPSAEMPKGDGGSAAATPNGANGSKPLGDRLADSHGVIKPPQTGDSELVQPTPDCGALNVIPAPGTPGGEPAPAPK